MKKLIILTICSAFFSSLHSQNESDSTSIANIPAAKSNDLEFIFRPTLGLGVGMFTFFGDVANNNKQAHPTVSRIGYDLRLSNPLNDYFDINFYVIFGKLSANERSLTNLERNLNFQSEIRTGGMTVSYNFQNFRKNKNRTLEPYVSLGIESFEFLSKTDLFDASGNKYHYWSDGSIRNLAENDPNSASAIFLTRDYVYESDLREQNIDGFGKYQERSWAIPVGAGAMLHLNERWKFRIGTSMHFAWTDLVDNISDESVGDRVGNGKKDKFLFTHFSVNYDLQKMKDETPEVDDSWMDEMFDILARDSVDTDGDGVVDFIDFCQYTPQGIAVNEKGCPFDKDADRVFDFQDDELNTVAGAIVDEKGVTVTDDMIYERYLRYIDSTGNLTGKIDTTIASSSTVSHGGPTASNGGKNEPKKYVVVLASGEKSISANEISKYLGYKDFQMIQKGDTVYYVVGKYDNLADAVKRKYELEKDGVKTQGVGSTGGKNGTGVKIIPESELPNVTGTNPENSEEVIFRVQIGAFTKPLPKSFFKNVPDLIAIKGDDGITRYYSGAFTDIYKASERKIRMLELGFEGSFVVAYKGGKRKPLSEVGVEVLTPEDTDTSHDVENTSIDKSKVKYRIQVGAFKNDVPTDILNKFFLIGQVTPVKEEGITKYVSGNFTSEKEAKDNLAKIKEVGITDAFVVADFNGKILTLEDLKKLFNE